MPVRGHGDQVRAELLGLLHDDLLRLAGEQPGLDGEAAAAKLLRGPGERTLRVLELAGTLVARVEVGHAQERDVGAAGLGEPADVLQNGGIGLAALQRHQDVVVDAHCQPPKKI